MIGKRIKQIRKINNLTQEEFAIKIGTHKPTISNWENDTYLPDYDNLIRISKTFNITSDFILGITISNSVLLKTDGLSTEELAHIQLIINDILKYKHEM